MNSLLPILGSLAYAFAISLQLTAALLLVGRTNNKREKIIEAYSAKHRTISLRSDGSLVSRSELEDTVNAVWTNRIAFTYLFFGYLISVFGKQPSTPDNMVLMLMFISVLTGALFYCSFKFAEKKALTFPSISKEDLAVAEAGVAIIEFDDDEL